MSRWYFPATTTEQWWLDSDDFQEINLLSTSSVAKAMIQYDPTRTIERLKLGYGFGETFVQGGGNRVRIMYSMGGDEDAFDRHMALVSVLREGREVSFAQNQVDTWAVALVGTPDVERGDTTLNYPATSIFDQYASKTDPAADTVCIVQSALPELHREVVELGSVNTGLKVAAFTGRGSHSGLVYDYTVTDDVDRRPILRPMYFFPFLRLAPGQKNICRQVDGLSYEFDAWFMVDVEFEHRWIGEAE